MKEEEKRIIRDEIAPVVQSGRAVLFLGAGYSCGTPTIGKSTIPLANDLTKRILEKAKVPVEEDEYVDLETAFSVGEDEIDDFYGFLCGNFKANKVFDWQKIPLLYWWRRIFTTNIDDVLEKCLEQIEAEEDTFPRFCIYNYKDNLPSISNPLKPPIVYLHGRIAEPGSGFVFDRVTYADHTIKPGDWLHDAAFHLSAGHCIILGSKLKESDLEAEIRKRTLWKKEDDDTIELNPNWIVLDKFSSVEKMGYKKRGLTPIEATSEEFFTYLSKHLTRITEIKLLKRIAPHLQIEINETPPVAWFNNSFSHVPTEIRKSKGKQGILSRFFTGDIPDWYYMTNDVPASFDYKETILGRINNFFLGEDRPSAFMVSVTGPIASGKSTLCKSILLDISKTIDAVYEFSSLDGVDIGHAWSTIKNVKGPIILFFDRSAEHFYALCELAKRFIIEKNDAKLLILIEDRDQNYARNRHHLNFLFEDYIYEFEVPPLSRNNARQLYNSIKKVGLSVEKIGAKDQEGIVNLICDTEKGYRGDLLATLCDITGHKSFEDQLIDVYDEIKSEYGKLIYQIVSIVSAVGLAIPIQYISEITSLGTFAIIEMLNSELKGKIHHRGDFLYLSARHPVIAEYHVKKLFSYKDKEELIIKLMMCISNKYCVKDIRLHPLPYRIYKKVLHHFFLKNIAFKGEGGRIEKIYSKCQSMFVDDGIFWLQYGRFLYYENRFDEAIHCFRKGLDVYDSFQVRHSLGQALLKRYVEKKCIDVELYDEGVNLLKTEITNRGNTDPYPYTALCNALMDILDVCESCEVIDFLKDTVNEGLKHHRKDKIFNNVINRGLGSGYLGL